MKKLISMLLALAMVLALCACGDSAGTAQESNAEEPAAASEAEAVEAAEPAAAEAAEPAAEGAAEAEHAPGLKYLAEGQVFPAETVKIGVPQYDETDSSAIAMKAYFDYLSQYLNIEFVYSEALGSAEDELAFVENCYVSGCKAILGSYDVIGHTIIDTCAEYGMYYLLGPSDLSKMEGDLYEQYKGNDAWIGGITLGNVNYISGGAVADFLVEHGVKKACYASGGAIFGVEMFVAGQNGFNDALNASGADIEIIDLPGFPSDEWFATQASILADPDLEAVTGLATPNFWAQPMMAAGRDDILLVSASGALDETNMNALKDGTLDFICFNNVEEHALNIIMLLNALEGDMDMVKPDGATMLVDANCWQASDIDYFMQVYNMSHSDEHIIDINDVCSVIKALNPDATFDDIYSVFGETDLDAILARHEANRG
ncbi:MAG: sugar ABC transporter substrate-binding protein [Oscillospiraceae bacterium]|nr:sugar ABC transporter substrate-binding protein [Oscillospiraceae bacterium]